MRFVAVETAERGAIIVLRVRLAAEQIIGEPAVAADGGERSAELLSALEIRQGGLRFSAGDRHRAHSGLRQRAFRIDLVGASEETGGCLGVAELERGLTCA